MNFLSAGFAVYIWRFMLPVKFLASSRAKMFFIHFHFAWRDMNFLSAIIAINFRHSYKISKKYLKLSLMSELDSTYPPPRDNLETT